MAKQERAQRTRQAILTAAAELFDERGYDSASTTDILARAGLTRGALYHHFPSKEAIALALLDTHIDALQVEEQPVKLQSLIDLTFRFAQQLQSDPALRASVRLSVEQSSFAAFQTGYEQSIEVIRSLLRQAMDQGEMLPGLDIDEATLFIVGAYTGVQTMDQAYSGRAELIDRIGSLWRFVLPGLATPGLISRLRTTPPAGAPRPSST
ncbi:TetR/AcrR family transcriptional regulator [Streptomyces sp. R302]|uniref:ScbR family autoregulator-binding transcription factor n=1 Tax=unclassified Streptomyces TaxID=2593676 RepID=UPI00145C9362|nr:MULTISPECIES: ScbR family autoregulator-binding transcription factor [unclassified Streptomyces]NML54091.1 TetR/AcrR family transcriptional regulator [Streptomyces sp. R301]NML83351.1 TetR/AcrR family transcriptional regulator [Streptomyces sp. R302]